MPSSRQTTLRLSDTIGWTATELKATGSARRGLGSGVADRFLERLTKTGRVDLTQALEVTPVKRRGAVPIRLEATTEAMEKHILMVRHPSGAITFHLPEESERRGASRRVRFSVPVSEESVEGERRGVITKAVRTFLLKVAGVVADKAMPVLGLEAEKLWWQAHRLTEGWKLVTEDALSSGKPLPSPSAATFGVDTSKPNLLLLHGTFSHTSSSFGKLASARNAVNRTFFDFAVEIYGSRIFGFGHFTVSRSPAENAKALLDGLPPGRHTFDVITHSRGGLVLRQLVELPQLFGSLASRISIRRAVLVASPNEGTPLASPSRFDLFLTWVANLLDLVEMVPVVGDSPFVVGAEFVADGLSWIANHVLGALPGLAAMDTKSDAIAKLQELNSAPPTVYSALVANFDPEGNVLQRLIDTGLDVFFGTANDLVVPSEGGWRVDPGAPSAVVPATRIGCYGRGGNLASPSGGEVTHLSFFNRAETVDFLMRALSGSVQSLASLDPATHLPFLKRRGALAFSAATVPPTTLPPPAALPQAVSADRGLPPPVLPVSDRFTDEVFYLTVMDTTRSQGDQKSKPESATLLASFRNASVAKRIAMRGGSAGQRFRGIIDVHSGIRKYINGDPHVQEPPHDEDLIRVGKEIFRTLFPGEVGRLYDIARAGQRTGRLNVIFTSEINWVADLPWEFVHDPGRETFLATSEVNFTRNVITAVPADRLDGTPGPLRILVVVAQPLGLAHLSVDEEVEVIRSGFRKLTSGGLAIVDVLLDATPDALHGKLEISPAFDVVHFIGHGEYDSKTDSGYLIFQTDQGRMQRVGPRDLQNIFCRRGIRLIFLNACETAEGGRADFNRGVAQALVAGGVPCVVANQYSVLDVSATSFAQHFYWALAQGSNVGDAARESRIAVNYSIPGENIDWAVPVVFARNPADRLAQPRQALDVARASALETRSTSRRVARGRRRVGLWDVQRVIPSLEQIATQLTDCQDRFAFEAVRFSAPLGTWRRERRGEGEAYLEAEKIAQRLRGKSRELGVERLIAITNLPLRDKKTTDLITWDDDPKNEISIISVYGCLEQLQPPLYTIERLVANALANFMSGLGAHYPGEKEGRAVSSSDCPLFYDENREIQYEAGALKLCALCRVRLRKERKAELIAVLEQILRAYP